MKTKISLMVVFVVIVQFVFGQCTIKQPRVDTSNVSICKYYCQSIKAYSNDTVIWYKINVLDTVRIGVGSQISDSVSTLSISTLESGLYTYLISSKNGCESPFTTLKVQINASTGLSMPNQVTIGYYDTVVSVSVSPKGGTYSFCGLPNNVVIMDEYSCAENKSKPSTSTDTSYKIQTKALQDNYYYTLTYNYYNEEGCGSSFQEVYRKPQPPQAPTGPSSYTFKFSDQHKIVSVVGDSAAIFTWYLSDYIVQPSTYKTNTLNLDSILSVLPLFPYSFKLDVKQTINGYEGLLKEITINYVNCLATQPIVASPVIVINNGDAMPAITASTTSTNCELRWYDLAGYNSNKQLRGVGASFVPTNCGDYCVISYDTVDACESNYTQVTLKEICSMPVKPIIDSIITDTIYDGYNGRIFSIANTLLPNQSCKWYVSDTNAVDYVGVQYTKYLPSRTNTLFVSIYDTLAHCESQLQKVVYNKIDCYVDFIFPNPPSIPLYLGDTIPVFTAYAPNKKFNWYDASNKLLASGNSFNPKITKAGTYSYSVSIDSGNCKIASVLQFIVNSNTISGSLLVPISFQNTPLQGQLLKIMPNDEYVTTDIYGNFTFSNLSYGTYTYSFVPSQSFADTVDSTEYSAVFNKDCHAVLHNFKITPQQHNDLTLELTPSVNPVVGRSCPIYITVTNFGSTLYNVPVDFHYSNYFSYSSKNNDSKLFKMDTTVNYVIDSIVGFKSNTTVIYLDVLPDFTLTGKKVVLKAALGKITQGDDILLNDTDSLSTTILNSFDPNDKEVSPCYKAEGYAVFGSPMTYTIRFQNKGTADAQNISIVDTLDANLDIATFEVLDRSDSMTFAITGRVLTFNFKNINLLDSATNETASHGFVKYRITPKTITTENTAVKNTAYIYFDYNPAVVTNTALSTFVSKLPVEKDETTTSHSLLERDIRVYPSLVTNNLTIDLGTTIASILIQNNVGQRLYSNTHQSGTTLIDCSAFASGVYNYTIKTQTKLLNGRFVKE